MLSHHTASRKYQDDLSLQSVKKKGPFPQKWLPFAAKTTAECLTEKALFLRTLSALQFVDKFNIFIYFFCKKK